MYTNKIAELSSFKQQNNTAVFVWLYEGTKDPEVFDTLPAWFAGGLDVDFHKNVLRCTVFTAVICGHSEFVHALLAVVQLLCVLDVACS